METRKVPDMIVVGAGPVGILTAIQSKLYDPSLNILIIEKYEDYRRKHLLRLDQHSFTDTVPDPVFQKFVSELPEGIRTNVLQDKESAYAKELGIEFEYNVEVKDCEELAKQYPDTNIFIGGDGSHSVVHKQIFDHEYQIQKNLQYIAEIKYEAEGKTRYLNYFETTSVKSIGGLYVTEAVGGEENGSAPVSVRVFIDEKTYKKMKEATFKNPWKLTDIDPKNTEDANLKLIHKCMHSWLQAREVMTKEKRIEDSEKITVTNLPVYASKEFVKEKYNKTWFLVGDAAFGMPYFRSLNNGILCSSQLAKTIYAMRHNKKIKQPVFANSMPTTIKKAMIVDENVNDLFFKISQNPIAHYANYVQSLMTRENFVAGIKNLAVNSFQASAATSNFFRPISTMKLIATPEGREYKARMDEEYPVIPSITEISTFKKIANKDVKKIENGEKSEVKEPESKSSTCNIF